MTYQTPVDLTREQESTLVLALAMVAMLSGIVVMFAVAVPLFVGSILSGQLVLAAAMTFATALVLWLSIVPAESEVERP